MPEIGLPEILIVVAVIVVLFGASRLGDLGGALGRGIREFRRAIREDDDTTAGNTKGTSGPT